MGDLYLAMAIVTVLGAAALAATVRVTRRWPRAALLPALLVGFAWLTVYVKYVVDAPIVATLMPVSSAVVLGNWTPVLAAALAGVAYRAIGGPVWRPLVTLVPLVGFAFYSAWWPVFSPRPATHDKLVGRVWEQSHHSTCSPAAAATLLGAYDIPATESEMVGLCLTTPDGTATLGIYRGLRLKTAGRYDVEFITTTVEELGGASSPMLLKCGIEVGRTVDPRYTRDWGWKPGIDHTVVLFRFLSPTQVEVGDPAAGLEVWTVDALRTLWRGEAIRLVPVGPQG